MDKMKTLVRNYEFTAYKVAEKWGNLYFATESEARAVAKGRKVAPVTLHRHHSATARGYVGVHNAYHESYNGRFGMGIVWHHTSKESGRGNAHHLIEYYVE